MKKIAVLLLLVIGLVSCGKKDFGTVTIKNDSQYEVRYGIGENYTTTNSTLARDSEKKIAWQHYFLFWIDTPKNIITFEKSNNTITIKDSAPLCTVIIKNKTGEEITVKDNGCFVLADKDDNNKYKDSLIVQSGTKECTFYGYLSDKNFEHLDKKQYEVVLKMETKEENGKKLQQYQIITISK